MPKKMLIDATHAEETRVVVVEGNRVEEFDFESLHKRQLAGNIYLAKVTRVEPSLQAAFVDYGGGRHGFLAFSEIHPDYYQIPVEDRQKLIDEEEQSAKSDDGGDSEDKPKPKRRSRSKSVSAAAPSDSVSGDAPEESANDSVSEASSETPSDTDSDTKPKTRTRGRGRAKKTSADAMESTDTSEDGPNQLVDVPENSDDKNQKRRGRGRGRGKRDNENSDDDLSSIIATRRARSQRYNIQEVIKHGQILLVQVVKEERGTKGAAMTTYLSLAGRYCVLMPNTSRGGGISRKISNAADRKKLKTIVDGIEMPRGSALIVRTAGSQRGKVDIERDYDYLLRQWNAVRDLTMRSVAPSQIYAEGDLIKRSIRDLYNNDIDEVLVEGEAAYNNATEYMRLLLPDHVKNVKLYKNPVSLFAKHQVEAYLATMFNPVVQLPSGGYIVINTTEALVAVDVNSGRSTKEDSIEETAVLTNLEAAREVARQARLRDLAGLIVIDFIDMDVHKNNAAVEKCLKESMKNDRARIQIGGISGFGLLEMSRQRLNPTMLEATTAECPHCQGSGIVRSEGSLALAILRKVKESAYHKTCKEVLVTVSVGVANYLLNTKREDIAAIEEQFQTSVRIEGSKDMPNGEHLLKEFKNSTRVLKAVYDNDGLVSAEDGFAPASDGAESSDSDEPNMNGSASGAGESNFDSGRGDDNQDGKKRKRRRRGGRGRNQDGNQDDYQNASQNNDSNDDNHDNGEPMGEMVDEYVAKANDARDGEAPKETSRPRRGRKPAGEVIESMGASESNSDSGESSDSGDTPIFVTSEPPSASTMDADAPTSFSASPTEPEAKPKPARRRKKASEVIEEVSAS